MATITAAQVKELRELTGAGMLECKKALEATGGDVQKAVTRLREQGLAAAAKKAGRIAAEGRVHAYIHGDGRIGVLLEVNSETDFVGKSDAFKEFCQDIAMQIAAMRPQYVRREEVPAAVIDQEREILKAQVVKEGKPEHIAEKIVEGRLGKFFTEICLLEQNFVKEPDKTVDTYLKETIAKIGENISIRRFTRYELGEGLEKRSDDFAAEVAAQVQGG